MFPAQDMPEDALNPVVLLPHPGISPGVAGVAGDAGVTPAFIIIFVLAPMRPSGTRPLSFCHCFMTAIVFGPKAPSTTKPRLSLSFKNL